MSHPNEAPPLLALPTPSRSNLSFCEPSPGALQNWLDALPKANLGETARQLYQGVLELNQLKTSAANRMSLLELIRNEIYSVSQNLERYFIDRPVVLDPRAHKVALLCSTLQQNLAIGYKQILEFSTPQERVGTLITLAIQRTLHALYIMLIRALQLYGPSPKGLWLELHQLYLLAFQEGVQHQVLHDRLTRLTETITIEQSYLAALLLGMARCNQLRRQRIGNLGELLEQWSRLTRLQKASALGTSFAILPHIDGPPRHRSLVPTAEFSGLLGIDTQPLVEALNDSLSPPKNHSPIHLVGVEHLDNDLLQRLRLAWSEVAERNAVRVPGHGHLHLCLGMTNVHYYLAAGRPFNELLLLHQTEAPKPAHFSSSSTDVWEQPFASREEASPWLGKSEQIGYTAPAHNIPTHPDYPTFKVAIINQSLSGYCLAWPETVPDSLQVGQVIGLHADSDQGWQLAVVRWIYLLNQEGQTQMGVQLLSAQATSCGVRLISKEKDACQYLRGLSVPTSDSSHTPDLLLVPLLPFQIGHKVQVIQESGEFQALLTQRYSGTPSYNLFEYQILHANAQPEAAHNPFKTPQASPSAAITSPEKDDGGFDSLWKSL